MNYAKDYSPFAEIRLDVVLKKIRGQKKMSQQKVADILEIDRSTYSYYETGKSELNVKTLFALCEIYGVTVNNFLNRDPVIKSSKIIAIENKHNEDERFLLSQYDRNLLEIVRKMNDEQRKEFIDHAINVIDSNSYI